MRRKAPTTVCVKAKTEPHLYKWLHGHDQSTSAKWGSGFKHSFFWYLQERESSSITFILNSLLQKNLVYCIKHRFLWYLQERESSSLTFILNSLLQKNFFSKFP